MIFKSKYTLPSAPAEDVFSYIFSHRRDYSRDRVLYQVDGSGETLTVGQLEEKSRQFAHVLVTRYSINSGDVVALLANDSIAFPIAYLGILAAGATVALVPVLEDLTPGDVVKRLDGTGTKLLITDLALLATAMKTSETLTSISLLILDGSSSQLNFFSTGSPEYHGFRLQTSAEAESQIAFLNRTSGSTGNMKSVLTTHAHFIAVLQSTLQTIPSNTAPDHDVWLSSLSLGFFINAKLHIGLNILLGIPVVLMKKPFNSTTIDVVERHRITFLFVPPASAAGLAGSTDDRRIANPDMSSIKWLLSAGAPMHEGLRRTISDKFNGVHLDLEWGTSETLLIAIQVDGKASAPGSSGVLVGGMEAKVLDTETGEELEAGEPGEILVRNAVCRFKGYKSNPEANRAALDEEGWFHSGDYGYLDEHCNVFITDRLKELIRVGGGYGVHVSATELEAVLFEHPAVAQVVVTGCVNERTATERPTAFVVLKPAFENDHCAALESLTTWANERLKGLQRLSGGIMFVPKFPQVSFKIDRRALRQMATKMDRGTGGPRYVQVS